MLSDGNKSEPKDSELLENCDLMRFFKVFFDISDAGNQSDASTTTSGSRDSDNLSVIYKPISEAKQLVTSGANESKPPYVSFLTLFNFVRTVTVGRIEDQSCFPFWLDGFGTFRREFQFCGFLPNLNDAMSLNGLQNEMEDQTSLISVQVISVINYCLINWCD